MKRREDLLFRQEMKFRNKLVEYLTDWIMGNSHQFNVQSATSANNELTTSLNRDLDQASMEATAALLAGLPLQPEENDKGDIMEAKSQLFLKYFTLFMNLLNDCSEDSQAAAAAQAGQVGGQYGGQNVADVGVGGGMVSGIDRSGGLGGLGGMGQGLIGMGGGGVGGGGGMMQSQMSMVGVGPGAGSGIGTSVGVMGGGGVGVVGGGGVGGGNVVSQQNAKTLQALRNSTIVAMSNLLNANIESGLMRSIALGYHRDPQTRAAFMEVRI